MFIAKMSSQNSFSIMFSRSSCIFVAMVLLLSHGTQGETTAVQLVANNINNILSTHEVVFVNFYADWCRFSQILSPVFEEAAVKVKEMYPDVGKVAFGKVDADAEGGIATQYHISKYPTLKLFRNGQVVKKEYRGQRSAEALSNFIKGQLEDTVTQHTVMDEIDELENGKRNVIGYFADKETDSYKTFRRIGNQLRDDCVFHAAFGEMTAGERLAGSDKVVFRPPNTRREDVVYNGEVNNYDSMLLWVQDKCVPLVREITFENAEELTEEGLPFLIFFHKVDDVESKERFVRAVSNELLGEKSAVNFLTADGTKFSHPLHHLGKTQNDLPVLAIDSFRHMYSFKHDIKANLETPGVLKQFVADLHSGKLHREFHHGPDPDAPALPPAAQGNDDGSQPAGVPPSDGNQDDQKIPQPTQGDHLPHENTVKTNVKLRSTPPESSFVKLKPSDTRYTLLENMRDEL